MAAVAPSPDFDIRETRFAKTYGTGEKAKSESRAAFMARCAKAALEDLYEVGDFYRTSGG